MPELPNDESNKQRVVTDGYFEREVRLSREMTATFLRELADQLEDDNELTVSGDDWEIPFRFGEPIEVEVEFIGERKRELEIELEFEWAEDEGQLNVE
ncbi:amphi-Trp domain-containing protein [Halogranum amylolyticum]|uniref:Amphi-Trp domain-containing protein n=1 Tax=Halogranum amylolyticum TaxID=660520 RepID=A0A1H8TI20_9EURY|nr:amphi-Trp domain-containing protein [Halogranum amylolyticum]SEO90730.1 amphi-Trp domain-containing protein [Halogranum amylolyticum]